MKQIKFLRTVHKFISISTLKKIYQFWKYYLVGLWNRTDEHHLFLSGGGIAFSLILSLVPIILLLISILGSILEPETVQEQISTFINAVIPYPKYAEYTKEAILNRIPEVFEYKTLAGIFGGFGLFFTSTWLFSSLRTVLNNIYGESKTSGILKALVRDFGMVILLIILVLLSIVILPLINMILYESYAVNLIKVIGIKGLLRDSFSVLSIIIIFIMFFLFYKLIPYAKLGRKVPLVSAFWATLLWAFAKNLFGYYAAHFLSANKFYGAFILIIVILFWIFYSSCLFIIGAEIGQLYRERKQQKSAA